MSMRKLNIILPPHATFKRWEDVGMFSRQKKYFQALTKNFESVIYSADAKDYSTELGIKHVHCDHLIDVYGIRHMQYYHLLLSCAQNMEGLIRVYGTSVPFLGRIKRKSKGKLIVSFHNDWGQGVKKDHPWSIGSLIGNSIQTQTLLSADLILATHQWLEKRAKEISPAKVDILPNFIDEEVFYPGNNKLHVIVFVGRIHWSKGIEYLIRGFAKLKKEFPDFILKIAGNGEDKNKFINLVRAESINDVQFLGSIQNNKLGDLLREAMIYVLPSVNMEGHPKALIEAMACGVAPIVTNVPGNKDLIIHENTGMVVSPKSEDEIYAALKYLIQNEKARNDIERNVLSESKQYFFSSLISKEIDFLNLINI